MKNPELEVGQFWTYHSGSSYNFATGNFENCKAILKITDKRPDGSFNVVCVETFGNSELRFPSVISRFLVEALTVSFTINHEARFHYDLEDIINS